jgi:hypothetical protein
MRKHPDAIALIVIGFALFASIGIDHIWRRLDQQRFRFEAPVLRGSMLEDTARDGAGAAVREVLRNLCTLSRK